MVQSRYQRKGYDMKDKQRAVAALVAIATCACVLLILSFVAALLFGQVVGLCCTAATFAVTGAAVCFALLVDVGGNSDNR